MAWVSATLAANVAHGLGHGLIGAAVGAWPAVALVGSYEDETSDAVKVVKLLVKVYVSGCGWGGGLVRECGCLVVVLAGGEAVVEAAEQAVEEVALGGGVPVAGVAAAVVVGAGAGCCCGQAPQGRARVNCPAGRCPA